MHEIINRSLIKKLLTSNRFFVRTYFNYLYLWHDPYHQHREEEIEKFEKAFRLVEGLRAEKALEIGCGEGRWSCRISNIAEKVVAFDISDKAIKRAKEINRDNPKIEYGRADIVTEDFPGETYDFIFCAEVLYYIDLRQLYDVVPKIINLLNLSGKLLLVHIRSLKDDCSGLDLKEFGAKTIHEAFIHSQQLELEEDIIAPNYRITLLHKI